MHEGVSIDALEKKQGLKLSVESYICISTESGVCFYSDCDFTQLSTDTNKYRRICAVGSGLKSLIDNPVCPQCTAYVLYMRCLYKLLGIME